MMLYAKYYSRVDETGAMSAGIAPLPADPW